MKVLVVEGYRTLSGEIEHDTTVDRAGLQFLEDLIHLFMPPLVNVSARLAFRCECNRLGEIFACADNRTADSDPFQNDIENGGSQNRRAASRQG